MIYKNYNDFELLSLIKEKNDDALDILYKKYKPVIELKARKYVGGSSNKGIDINDLIQEGMIGFSQAIENFKENKNIKFSTFASLCIEREIQSAVTKANRNKHKLLNESLSLDYTDGDDEQPLIEYAVGDNNYNPEEYFLDLETEKETFIKIMKYLTPLEKEVFELKMNNFDYKEIAQILDKKSKAIDNALQRIKNKIKNNKDQE